MPDFADDEVYLFELQLKNNEIEAILFDSMLDSFGLVHRLCFYPRKD